MVPINPNCTPKYDCRIGNVMEYVLYFCGPWNPREQVFDFSTAPPEGARTNFGW